MEARSRADSEVKPCALPSVFSYLSTCLLLRDKAVLPPGQDVAPVLHLPHHGAPALPHLRRHQPGTVPVLSLRSTFSNNSCKPQPSLPTSKRVEPPPVLRGLQQEPDSGHGGAGAGVPRHKRGLQDRALHTHHVTLRCQVVRQKIDPNSMFPVVRYSFSREDAELLASMGYNTIRLGVLWAGVEPVMGEYNQTYLDKVPSPFYPVPLCLCLTAAGGGDSLPGWRTRPALCPRHAPGRLQQEVCSPVQFSAVTILLHQVLRERGAGLGCPAGQRELPLPAGGGVPGGQCRPPQPGRLRQDTVAQLPLQPQPLPVGTAILHHSTVYSAGQVGRLYKNYRGLLDRFAQFWGKLAETFSSSQHVLGWTALDCLDLV